MDIQTPAAEVTEVAEELDIKVLWKLSNDLRKAADTMSRDQARYVVDLYYQLQKFRIACAGQIRSQENEPHDLLTWFLSSMTALEGGAQASLGRYAKQWAVGAWLQSICGIGPVISAGLLAHIDIRKCKTFGQLWRFAGMDPTCTWEKKTKRPWNATLKTLVAFKLGECFVKVQNNDKDFYGKLYATRKQIEIAKNEAGEFRDAAAAALNVKKYRKETEAYKAYSDGRLPPAHIHARARRYAVKLFLSHLHHMMHVDYYGSLPPKPYIFEHQGPDDNHRHYIEPPNQDAAKGRPLKELFGE